MNYLQKQAALQKLAQVRLAVNYVLRNRGMMKRAEGGLDPADAGDYHNEDLRRNAFLQNAFNQKWPIPLSNVDLVGTNKPKNSLGGILQDASYQYNPSRSQQFKNKI